MNSTAMSRPQLKIRRINLDTGRENVVLLATLLITGDGSRPSVWAPRVESS